MSVSYQSLNANATDRRNPSKKRRRNASGAWQYISQTTRKCLVESCTKTFSKKTATTTLIYHLDADHGITVNDGNIEEANDPTIDDSSNDEDGDEDEDCGPISSATTGSK